MKCSVRSLTDLPSSDNNDDVSHELDHHGILKYFVA